jgi:hypothetical protein
MYKGLPLGHGVRVQSYVHGKHLTLLVAAAYEGGIIHDVDWGITS